MAERLRVQQLGLLYAVVAPVANRQRGPSGSLRTLLGGCRLGVVPQHLLVDLLDLPPFSDFFHFGLGLLVPHLLLQPDQLLPVAQVLLLLVIALIALLLDVLVQCFPELVLGVT